MAAESDEIRDLLHNNNDPSEVEYDNVTWRHLPDINQGNYSGLKVTFDTNNLLSSWVVWSRAFIEMSFTTQSSGAAYNDITDAPISVKNHISSMISNVLVKLNNVTVSQQRDIPKMGWVKYLLDHSVEQSENGGDEVLFSKDRFGYVGERNIGAFNKTSEATAVSYAGSNGSDNTDISLNRGFWDRLVFRDATIDAGVLTFKVRIPLSILPIFEEMSMPMTNLRLQMTFDIAQKSHGYQPLMYSHFLADGVTETVAPVPLSIVSGTKLWYPAVTFSPQQSSQLATKISSGLTKTFNYLEHKRYIYSNDQTQKIDWNITSGLSGIERLFVMLTPPVATGNTEGVSHQDESMKYSSFPMGGLTDIQLLVDNKQYFESPIEDDHVAYQLFCEALAANNTVQDPRSSKLITFNDWKNNYRIYCFDIARNTKYDSPQAISFKARKKATGVMPLAETFNVDCYIQYRTTTTVNLTTSQVSTNMQ
jgi:hypothetical protein